MADLCPRCGADPTAVEALRARVAEVERARDNHARTLYAEGYSPCAAAECNCGGWHGGHVAELRARLRNVARTLISEVGAGGPMNAEAAAEKAVAVILGLREERDEARREIDAGRAHTIALEQQNVALLRWQSVASDAHVDHLCAIIRSLAVSDETPRVLRDLSADGVESEIRRAFKAERINREKSESTATAARKERDDMAGMMLDERTRADRAERERDALAASLGYTADDVAALVRS